MTITSLYAGVDQADSATLTTGGVSYYCTTWHNDALERVEAKIFAYGEDGQIVLVDESIVAVTGATFIDCPRVLAVGTLFVCHWIDSNGQWDSSSLFRSIFDVTAFASGWVSQGSIPTYQTNQYDHAVVDDGAGEFVVCHRTAAGQISTIRYSSPFSWVDIAWSTAVAGLTIADTVLAVTADESNEDTVLFVYQSTLTIQAYRMDATDGTNGAAGGEVFADVLDGDMNAAAVSIKRVGVRQCVVTAELLPDDDDAAGRVYHRIVASRVVDYASAGALFHSQLLHNVHLLSRTWTYASGTTGQVKLYGALSFKSIADGQEYDQQYGYIVDFDAAAFTSASYNTVRPILLTGIMDGSVDARPHGASLGAQTLSIGARLNHLPHATAAPQYALGPSLKSVRFALIRWSRLVAARDGNTRTEVEPVGAMVGWIEFDHEDPWTIRRDANEPTQPDTPAWKGINDRPLALPVPTPAGLVFAGGATTIYDGQQPVEIGFPWAPEILTITPAGAGGTMDVEAEYTWVVIPSWQDARGTIHRGPPSRPVSATIEVNGFATLRIRCINLQLKDDRNRFPLSAPISLEVYRTYTVGGELLTSGAGALQTYILRSEFGGDTNGFRLQDTPANDPDTYSIDVIVGVANDRVQWNDLCPYQLNLATLQWEPPAPTPMQPLAFATLWQNRLFGVDPISPEIVYSEEILTLGTNYVAPYFLDTNRVRVDGRRIVAMQSMDSVLLLFAPDAIYSLAGEPASGGVGSSLQLSTIVHGIGCIEPRSVILTSEGVFFQSAQGIHLVTRGLSVEYPGAAVEDRVREAGNIRGASQLPDRHEARFLIHETPGTGPLAVRPRVLVFNWKTNLWSTAVLPMLAQATAASRLNEYQHSASWRGRSGQELHVILAQGAVAIERADSSTVYADINSAGTSVSVGLDVTTEWIHLAGVAGLKRIKEIGVQFVWLASAEITVEIWYDIDGSYDDSGAADQTHTETAPTDGYLRIRPDVEKVSALKVRVYESGTVPATETVRLQTLLIHWVGKGTPRRVRLQ